MTDVDNPEVGAETPVAEGQNQETSILGNQDVETTVDVTQDATQDWRDNLPDDLKSAKSLQSIKSVEDLAKGFVNAQSVIGRRFEDLSPEQVKEYYKSMGTPESPDQYEIEAPEGVEMNQDLADWYKKTAHKHGVPKEAAENLFRDYMQMEMEQTAQQQELTSIAEKEQLGQLKKDFGPAYDERVKLANRALTEFGGDEAIQAIHEAGLANNPTLIKLLANAGETLAEGKFVSGQQSGKFGMTSEEASQKITALRNDPEFMNQYANPSSPRHNDALSKMQELYKIKVNVG